MSFAISSQALAQEKLIESKAAKAAPAAGVDFGGELGLGFASLKTLGTRIDQAIGAPDPVGLAACAAELAVAEKVAKKQASIKSGDLMKQAVELAKARRQPAELEAVAMLATNDADKKELQKIAAEVAKEVAARKGGSGEKQRGVEGRLYVDNRTGWYVSVVVNGSNVGSVNPYSVGTMYVGQSPIHATTLYGYASGTSYTWGPKLVDYRVNDYTWRLTD